MLHLAGTRLALIIACFCCAIGLDTEVLMANELAMNKVLYRQIVVVHGEEKIVLLTASYSWRHYVGPGSKGYYADMPSYSLSLQNVDGTDSHQIWSATALVGFSREKPTAESYQDLSLHVYDVAVQSNALFVVYRLDCLLEAIRVELAESSAYPVSTFKFPKILFHSAENGTIDQAKLMIVPRIKKDQQPELEMYVFVHKEQAPDPQVWRVVNGVPIREALPSK